MTPEQLANIAEGMTLEEFNNWVEEQPADSAWFTRDPHHCPIAFYTRNLMEKSGVATDDFNLYVTKTHIGITTKTYPSEMPEGDEYYQASITLNPDGAFHAFIWMVDKLTPPQMQCNKPTVLEYLSSIADNYEKDIEITAYSLISHTAPATDFENGWQTLAKVQHRKELPIEDTP